MCQDKKAGILAKKEGFSLFLGLNAQAFAQVAQGQLRNLCLALLTLVFVNCAGPKNEGVSRIKADTFQGADAVLITGKQVFIFDFAHSRFQKWPHPDLHGMESCVIGDTLAGDWSASSHWLSLASPVQPFKPSQAIWGPNGNFFLLDRTQKRIALYDTNAQFLSGFTIPPQIMSRNLNRMDVYWTRDGMFSFLDRSEGKLWKFTEVRSAGGSGDWQLRYTVNLPLGINSCIWEPFSKRPICLSEKSSAPIVFDEYFNSTQDSLRWTQNTIIRPIPNPAGTGWDLILPASLNCGVKRESGRDYLYSSEAGRITVINVSQNFKPDSIPPQP